jgi:hypothetical protein
MEKLPEEIINKIFMYMSSPTADIMKPHIKAYNQYAKVISNRFDTMPFIEFMSVNAIYLDFTSKRHLRENNQILQMFKWN